MKQDDLEQIRTWFSEYVATYHTMDPDGVRNIILKEDHTGRVCAAMSALSAGENLPENDRLIAEATALLHDAGRFEQYRRWRTFRDSVSDNHARMAVDVIREHGVLKHIPESERLLIEEAVRFHNLLTLPDKLKSPTDLFCRLIRDADKLDIWRVFIEYFNMPLSERPDAVSLDLPDEPTVTQACIDMIEQKQIVRLDSCRYLNDYVLLLVSWVFDLRFPTSYRLLLDQGHLTGLAERLPRNGRITSAVDKAISYARLQAAGSGVIN